MANNTQALPASRMLSQPTSCNSCLRFFISSIIWYSYNKFTFWICFPLNSIFVCQRYSNLSQSAEKKKEWRGSKSLLEHKPKCEYRWIHSSKSSLHMTLCVYMYTTASTVSHHAYYIIRFYQSLWWQQRRPKGICSSNPTVISILKSQPLMTIYPNLQ